MVNVILNAGHGAGKKYNRGGLYYNEGDNNYLYSLVLKQELETYNGINVDLVRNKIEDNPPLAERHKFGEGYDLFMSIHSNGFRDETVQGTEVFDSVEKPNKQLAKMLCDSTAEFFNHRNRGVKYREGQKGFNWYAELRFNQAKSAMILENGFHTNHEDCLTFKNQHKEIAEIQAREIASFYGLRKKEVITYEKWKLDIVKEAHQKGLITDLEMWENNVNDNMPVWAVLRVVLNGRKD